ncbi:peptidoglycan DD-metalloendopeptidase family protein [Staphylococcus equorum]|uniref:peptidoglycan DD-metalloendopeptidase family protein n=1 Tax=Staphylococcus equorum TaxID=246432 RepID=UPI001F599BCC|nr:peptidoglycan DD-metalloendopeptidase family protein [Staphylococcus equorum]UNP87057.1 peptidoglycan DD-metalloendopeptidase family protein [Staphylococcus equorum]
MADFNLSAEVSMDVDPLKASKTTIERNLKAINKSLRDQRKEFKQNEASAESLAKQEGDLGRAVKLQEGLLKQRNKTLDEMQRQMKQSNNVTDEQKIKLQNASRAVQQAENQLNGYENELKQTQAQQKLLGRSTDTVKNSLGQLRNEAKLTEMRFKQSEKSVSGYKNRLTELSHTMQKQKAHTDLLKGNLRELERAQQGNSREAKGLRNDIIKEALAFQVLQGRIDETTDELKEYQRQQRLMGTATRAWVGAREQMDRIATTLRSLGELTQGIVGGVMTTHFSALVPILGSIVSLGAGLGGMLVASAGGAIGMGGAFGIAGVAVKAFAGQATYALKMLEDGQLRVTNEVTTYQTALDRLKSSWEGLIAQNQAAIFNTMTNGINTARFALNTLNPFLTKTATQIETASGKMLDWAKNSANAKKAFDILNTQGPKIFQHLLNATQSFVNGSAALFNKLSPLYGWAAKGFANMAKSFDNWANSVQGSKAINGFIEYTKTNLPIVGSIFGNVFKGIISLFQAFSGHSHNVLVGIKNVTKGFAEWSEGLKKSDGFKQFVQYLEVNGPKVWTLIKNITSTLWGLAKGMAPVGAAVLSMSGAFFKWTATMTNAHPIIGKILGIMTALGGVTLLAAKPILLLRGALLGATGATKLFGNAGAIAAIKTNVAKTATKLWTATITLLSTAMKVARGQLALQTVLTGKYSLATKLAAVASRGLGLAIRFMTGPIGWVITAIGLLVAGIMHLWKTNATFRNAVISIWNSIKSAAIATFGFLKPYIVGIWNGIKTASIWIWNTLKSAAVATWNGIKFAVQNPMQALKNVLSAIWKGIKATAIWIWNALKTGVVNIVKALVNGVKWYITTVKTVISTVFNAAKAIAIRIWTAIKNTVVNLAKGLWTGVKNAFTSLKNSVTTIFNVIKNFLFKVWITIRSRVISLAVALYNGVRKAFNSLKNSVTSIFNAIKNFSIKVWTTVKNAVISRAKALWNGVKNNFNGLKNSVTSIFNAVKNFAIKVWTLMKNRIIANAKLLWNGVRNTFNALRKGVTSIFNAVKNFSLKLWTNLKNGTISRAKALWTGVRNTFNALKKGTTNIFNAVSSYMSNKWNSIKSGTINKAKALWSGVKGAWSNLNKGTRNTMNSVGKFMSSKWSSVKSNTVNKAKDTWSGVRGAWSSLSKGTRNTMNSLGGFMSKKWSSIRNGTVNLVDSLKSRVTGIMSKMGDGIKGTVSKIKGFFTDMIGSVKSGLNKLIEGVNFVGKKLGMDKIDPVNFHTGTTHTQTNLVKNGKVAKDTLATVGDKGRGNGPGGFRHETIIPPKGKAFITPNRDTTMPISKGTAIMNGAQTHAMLSNSNPEFASGTIPKFAKGTGWDMLGGGGSKPKKHKKDDDIFGDIVNGGKALKGTVVEGGKAAVTKTLEGAAKGTKWLGDAVGDVMDWIDKPGKLLDKVLEGFGVDMGAFGIGKGASLPFDMMKGMFSKLKKATVDLFTSWMEEQGGDGGYIDLSKGINFGFHKTAASALASGYPFASPHHGLDINYKTGDKLYSTVAGTATAKEDNSGFGKHMWIKSGIMDVIYGHMSKFAFNGSKKVKPGTYLGESGNTGKSSGPHLHYEMRKNGVAFDPTSWLKKNNGGGGKKKPSAWGSTIDKAAKKMKVNLSSGQRKGLIAQIARESNGDAGVTQNAALKDGNAGKNLAQGLLQYVPSTFDSFKVKGHGNIKSGYDQLLAFFNNSNWKNDLQYGKSGWGPNGSRRYATGTNNARRGFNQVFEEGGEIMQMRGGETVIPNDVSIQAFKQIATSDIFNRTQTAVYDAISQYADQLREKQQAATREQQELSRLSRENTDIKEQNGLLKQLLGKMDALLNSNQNIETSNQEIRDKNYFPTSREMTKMNNENMALNNATRLMR